MKRKSRISGVAEKREVQREKKNKYRRRKSGSARQEGVTQPARRSLCRSRKRRGPPFP